MVGSGFSLRSVLRFHLAGVSAFVVVAIAAIAVFAAGVVRASGLSRRARPATVTFGAPRTLAASGPVPNSQAPVAAINARGESLVAWFSDWSAVTGRLDPLCSKIS